MGSAARDPAQAALRAGRLQTLEALGLTRDIGGARYQLSADLETTLRAMGERGDIVRTLQRELTARRLERSFHGSAIFDGSRAPTPLVGRVVSRGLADEHEDRHYLIVDGVDGQAQNVGLGKGEAVEPLADGAVVRVTARHSEIRDVDRTVAIVAAAHDGRYSVDLHLRHDPSATQRYAEAHVRRLEAIRRSVGLERGADGVWSIGPDHLSKVEAHEARQHRDRPVAVEILSPMPIAALRRADAATWLDRELASDDPIVARSAGFGRDLRTALAARRQWLVEQELVDPAERDARLRSSVVAALQRRELLRVADGLTSELGKPFVDPTGVAPIEGRLARKIETLGGRFALVEKAREFTLVPWRPVLENHIGKQVSGQMRTGGIDWQIGRGRASPELS